MGSRSASIPALAIAAVTTTLLLAAVPATASADANVENRPRHTFSIGVGGGGHQIADDFWAGAAVEVGLGWRLQQQAGLEAIGEVTLQRLGHTVDDGADQAGTLGRLGLTARYPLKHHRFDWSAVGQLWISGGAALAHYDYDGGGSLDRRELILGVGGSLLGFTNRRDKQHYPGFYMDLRIVVAEAPDPLVPGATAVCAGACKPPTTRENGGTDLGFFWTFGYTWGM